MKHGTMRFSGLTLHHNPSEIELLDVSELSEDLVIGCMPFVCCNGEKAAVLRGEGVFYGENAFEQYLALRDLYKNGTGGALSVSGIRPFYAFLARLGLKCMPVDDVVEYSFTFIEAPSLVPTENSTAPLFHTAADGQDLWDISGITGVSVDTLVMLNPQLKSPCEVSDGDKIRVRK